VGFDVPKYVVDPKVPNLTHIPYLKGFSEKASIGLGKVWEELVSEGGN
jgi:hypothetical protein